jgi:hypothetical protein
MICGVNLVIVAVMLLMSTCWLLSRAIKVLIGYLVVGCWLLCAGIKYCVLPPPERCYCCSHCCCRYRRYYLLTIATSFYLLSACQHDRNFHGPEVSPNQAATSLSCLLCIQHLPPYLHILPLPTALPRLALVTLTLLSINPINVNAFPARIARSFKFRCC